MPAIATLSTPSALEMQAVRPRVEIDGSEFSNVYCLSVEQSVGGQAGKALLRIIQGRDVTGPTTLGKATQIQYGSRIRVFNEDQIYFLGNVIRRNDQGATDLVLWEAVDDRIFLESLFVRGAIVCENPAEDSFKAKFCSRFIARTNPQGLWNCVYMPIGGSGNGYSYPVFAPIARRLTSYETPDDEWTGVKPDGQIVPWTPRRFLQYLWLLANVSESWDITGINFDEWRSIYQSQRLVWYSSSISGMNGTDPAEGETTTQGGRVGDPLDRKMPDMTFQGQRLLGSMLQVLDTAGTHGLRLQYGDQQSWIDFYTVGFTSVQSGENTNDGDPTAIPLQRGGSVDDINTAFDFDMSEDVSQACESVLAEGAPVHVETRVQYDPTDPANGEILPAWTDAEEAAFLCVINGGTVGGTVSTGAEPKAKVPRFAGDTDNLSSWLDADGNSGRPWARARTKEAVAIARQYFPRVFKAFRLDTGNLTTALDGFGAKYSNRGHYPQLDHNRQILPTQLQYIRKLGAKFPGDTGINWLVDHLPVRIEVKSIDDLEAAPWTTSQFGGGLRQTPDGLIWLDGIAEERDSESPGAYSGDCIYSGSLYNFALKVAMKKVRINIAFPMDHRLKEYVATGPSIFTEGFLRTLGGQEPRPMMFYLDAPSGFQENHQVASHPLGGVAYYGGTNGTILTHEEPDGLSRILPPGTEQNHLFFAAKRKLWKTKQPLRRSSWKLIGIRAEWRAGNWISKIKVRGATGDSDVTINAPIENVTYDFQSQETRLGGMTWQGMI